MHQEEGKLNGGQIEWNNSLKACMGLKESWSRKSRESGLERDEMTVKCIDLRLIFLKEKGRQKTHEESTAQNQLFRETGGIRHRLKKIIDMKSLNTAQRT